LGIALGPITFTSEMLLLFLAFILAGFLIYGLCTILAVFAVFFRDIGHMMPVFIQTLFFISPVAYSLDKAPPGLQWILLMNPFTLLIEFVRQIVMHQIIQWPFLLGLGTWAVISIFVGQWFLNKMNHKIVLYA
jgi:lipopolysaccharide transport system permease protein